MSDKLPIYTSNGQKLFRQGELLSLWNKGIPKPQSLQVALTEVCNLKCVFCSVANRTHKYVWDYDKLLKATKNFIDLGIKTIELSIKDDELIPMKEGDKISLKTIKEVVTCKKGSSFTLNNNNQFDEGKITDFIEHPQTEPLYKITLDDGRNITVTKSHSIFFFENNEIVYKKISDTSVGDVVVVLSKNPEVIEEDCGDDFARLLGYFVAEGSYSWQREKVPHGIQFTFAKDEKYVDDVVNILKNLGYKSSVYAYEDNKTPVYVFSKKLCELFLSLNLGVGARQKRVPDIILNGTYNNKIEFLKGLYAGDGNFRSTIGRHGYKRNTMHLKTASKIMTQSLSYLFDMMGIWHTVQYGMNKKRFIKGRELQETDFYTIDISNREDLEKLKDVVEFMDGKFNYANSKYSCHTRNKKRIPINSDCFGIKIKKIEEVPVEEKVYDISVKDTHRFESSFRILCHNTGGGEPTLYPHINEYIMFLKKHNIQIGLITNGININSTISKHLLNDISWIRISSNVLDYRDKIDIPEGYTGTLGFSYCWTEGISSVDQLRKIQDIAKSNNVQYIRLVPNCLATTEEQIINNERLSKLAETIGEPLFFQAKVFDTPSSCFWGYLKPFLYPDEYIYPCSSSILNDAADKQFNPIYRWYHYEDTKKIYSAEIKSAIDTKNCNHCVFTEQNKMMEYALNKQIHEDFI